MNDNAKRYTLVIPCMLAVVAAGCSFGNQTVTPAPMASLNARPQVYQVSPPATNVESGREGSLYTENNSLSELFINAKAKRVGDIVTIRIVESSSATNKADTNTDRNSSLTAGIDSFFGTEKRFSDSSHPSYYPYPDINPFGKVSGSLKNGFKGTGSTNRSGKLTAFLTARVVEVFPSGNLRILGTREITVNNERQILSLTGIVRPRDISPTNVVQSTYISDAKIMYSGTGIVNDKQKPGWLSRLIDGVWPF